MSVSTPNVPTRTSAPSARAVPPASCTVLTPKIATVAARLLDGARDRVKADSNRTVASLTTLRAGDRRERREEESKGTTESLSKQVEEDEQEEEEAVNLCAFLSPSQIPEERGSGGLFVWICDTGTNCF